MVWNDAENRDRDWGETLTPDRVRKTLTPRVADFFADFEKKTRLFCSLGDQNKDISVASKMLLTGVR